MEQLLRPMIVSLKISGLLPFKRKSKLAIAYVYFASICTWLQTIRHLPILFVTPLVNDDVELQQQSQNEARTDDYNSTETISSISADESRTAATNRYNYFYLYICVYLVTCSLNRFLSMWIFVWSGTRKKAAFKLVEKINEELVHFSPCAYRQFRIRLLINTCLFWLTIFVNFSSSLVTFVAMFDEMQFIFSPLHLIAEQKYGFDDWRRYLGTTVQVIGQFYSDTSLLLPCLGLNLALILSKCFQNLGNHIKRQAVTTKKSRFLLGSQHLLESGPSPPSAESLSSADSNNDELTMIDVEIMRRRHLRLCRMTETLDQSACFANFTVSFSLFVGILICLFVLIWDPPALLLWRLLVTFWLVCLVVGLVYQLLIAGQLNHSAHAVIVGLHGLESKYLAKDVHTTQQLVLFNSQLTFQPIGLTLLGVVHLQKNSIFTLFGLLLTYYLILMDFSGVARQSTAHRSRAMIMHHVIGDNASLA